MKVFLTIICTAIFFFVKIEKLFCQNKITNLSGSYLELNKNSQNGSLKFLQIAEYRKNYFYFSLKSVDSSNFENDLSDLNLIGLFFFDSLLNKINLIACDDFRIRNLSLEISEDSDLIFSIYRRVIINESSSNLLDISSGTSKKNSIDTLVCFLKKYKKYSLPLFNFDNNSTQVFNFTQKNNKSNKVNFYLYPDSLSECFPIQFTKDEHIVVVNSIYKKEDSSKITYFLVYLKPKSRITEGKYEEYQSHFWIKAEDLYMNFRFQK
jgi:hypothetical protein